jgi:hypothetical protein
MRVSHAIHNNHSTCDLKTSGEAGGVILGVPGDVNPPNKFVKFPSRIVISGRAAPKGKELDQNNEAIPAAIAHSKPSI